MRQFGEIGWIILLLVSMGASSESASLRQAQGTDTPHLSSKYVCPMHSHIIRDAPGTCPICGMTLVLKEIEENEDRSQSLSKGTQTNPIVTIKANTAQAMGIRTATATLGNLTTTIKTVGYVAYDQDHIVHVHARANGWIEKLYVHAEGNTVKQDEPLLELSSPKLLATLKAPQAGVVTRLNAREGMYITSEQEIFTIADTSSVWILVDIFEPQARSIRTGLKAKIEINALAGNSLRQVQGAEGIVDYIYPELDPKTRTLKARIHLANPQGIFKPNMFAQVTIESDTKPNVLTIPQEALIITGERQSVIKLLSEGKFQPVDVTTGVASQGNIEILSGLQAGDRVVVSGQFLIDSEANLRASFSRLNSDNQEKTVPPAHQH